MTEDNRVVNTFTRAGTHVYQQVSKGKKSFIKKASAVSFSFPAFLLRSVVIPASRKMSLSSRIMKKMWFILHFGVTLIDAMLTKVEMHIFY